MILLFERVICVLRGDLEALAGCEEHLERLQVRGRGWDLPFAMLMVFATASLAAFCGDMALYWLGRRGVGSKNGSRWLAAIRSRAPEDRLEQAQGKLAEHDVAVLVLSRLVPAGRIPVMLACLLAGWPLRRFARGNLPACLAWAATYQLIGVLSGALFDEPWEGVAAAIALTVLVSAAPGVWRRIRGPEKA